MTIMVFCYVLYRFVMKKIPVGSTIYGSPKYTERVNPYKDHIYVFCLGGVVMNILFFKNISNLFPEYSFWIMGISIVQAIVFVSTIEYTFEMQTPAALAEKYGLRFIEQCLKPKPKFEKLDLSEEMAHKIYEKQVVELKLISCLPEDIIRMLQLEEPINKIILVKPSKNPNYTDKRELLEFVDMLFNFAGKEIERNDVYLFTNKYFACAAKDRGAIEEITRKNVYDHFERFLEMEKAKLKKVKI